MEELKNAFREKEIFLSDDQAGQYLLFTDLVLEKNKEMNLTAITEWKEFLSRHIMDSISLCLSLKEMTEVSYSLIDVGTGAGFPGIPLKILCPSLKVTLLDSLRKRVDFLNESTEKLHLTDIKAVHGRAEDLGKDSLYREQYDFAVSRAVAKMTVLSEICLPFVKPGGIFAAYKTADSADEVETASEAIRILGGDSDHIDTFSYPIEGFDVERELFLIKKKNSTPEKYPRRAGQIEKKPLGV